MSFDAYLVEEEEFVDADAVDIDLLPSQYEFMVSETPHTAFIGGLGSGKTWVGSEKHWQRALAPQNFEAIGFIGANTYKQLTQATLATLFEVMDSHGVAYRYNRSMGELWIENRPAPILCWSLDNYDALRGVKLGFAWLDETARTKVEAFMVVVGRMRHPGADLSVDITTTPDGFNWLYDKFVIEPEENPKIAEIREAIHASTYENYHLPDFYFEALEATYDDLMLEQEVEGKFINIFGGRCYRTFDRTQHMDLPINIDRRYPLDLCLDFNIDPMCSAIAQHIPSASSASRINVVDEIVLPFSDTPSVCAEFIRRYPKWGAGVRVYGDAAGITTGATAGKTDYAVIREELSKRYALTIDVPKANPPVIDRVNSVNALFRRRDPSRRDRVVGRVAKGKAPNLARDLEQVRFKEGTRVIDKTDPKLTHSSDAFGYYVHKVARLGRYTGPPVRTIAAQHAS